MTDTATRSKWVTELNNRIQTIVHNLGLNTDLGAHMKEFVFQVAREQYMAGNKNGIRWARTNPPRETA
ncbi:MAG: hypothetical protein UU40_C0019G0002 [Candidatus Uhrbacteria bacterium GW2011_GWD2_41_121]|uniref:PH domain-containing protein n=1 Tax=Candidatus Uhrbacteria bacterium GW2011_GWC1_41_20 TaxID=1618983 RepID=A0A0G0V9R3_9BACT|nr:MAG: hypothetical protein UT52_C0020G0002 [Candidatus Uhrbacteria bacterium GW2011_GWE1_39_46]KKR63383.1 MAG: hypothetical protein UU04_C0019G0016 [Candidatus Uhrbacteria bacterium GW2011_GWC2_40_450]KKR89618.1 MAG: hypothetical protein UU40_C0019G0002 [Candidatus Uhrbacteria bacterium GW2011_GWD2_41_121]KKR95375.1 MAG: hypothetical protein UU46_C0024G0002 [Candidatus Uhrbacteria bacterium GW2011_GWD1_41_16]KKR97664.1 MAG: hypothetical protein UU50_C0026G0002 [Candidatus Uhrbacteria bacteriu